MGQTLVEGRATEAGKEVTTPRADDRATVSGFRPDIQGLRAIAVGVVVLFHLWPNRLSGGYVGVDVFFVISGFLITGHLWREAQERGTISMRSFYARRALRLLPASILVLICTAVASLLILPDARWDNTFNQLVASAAYVQNWLLARNSVDYLLQNAADSPAQHFWSLSVEEQFYAFWPLLIVVVIWVMAKVFRKESATARRRTVIAVLSALLLASLAYSIYETAVAPKQAYFVTPTRVWEFAAGALCALIVYKQATWFRFRMVLGWAGLGAILAASYFYVKATPFPGYAALLPVLGTAAVILGAQSRSPLSASWWLSLRPATVIGDISYAIYLWHWPLLVLVPIALARELDLPTRLTILAATLVLSALSTHLMETPLRRNNFLRQRRWPSLAMALGGVAAMVAVALLASAIFQARVDAAAARFTNVVTAGGTCHGAAVFDEGADCPSVFGEGPIMAPALAIKDQGNTEYSDCDTWLDRKEVHSCDLGPADSPVRVAIVGDSHALQWLGTVKLLAKQGKWRIKTFFKTSCPFIDAQRVIPSEPREWQQNCTDWQEDVKRQIIADKGIDYVLVTAYSSIYTFVPNRGGPSTPENTEKGFRSMWKQIIDSGKKVVVVRDTPTTLTMSIPECIQRHMDDFYKCSVPREKALPPDPITQIAQRANDPNVLAMDVNGGMCDATYCYGIAGNVIVYRDTNHLTWQYAESLAPRFWAEFSKAIEVK